MTYIISRVQEQLPITSPRTFNVIHGSGQRGKHSIR